MNSEYVALRALETVMNRLSKMALIVFGTAVVCLTVVIGTIAYVKLTDKPHVPKSNEAIARQLFETHGYNPINVTVNTVEGATYCGELTNNGTDLVWFKVDERGVNIFQNGTVYFSQNSTQIIPVIENLSLETFQQYCELRTERNPYDAQYENLNSGIEDGI